MNGNRSSTGGMNGGSIQAPSYPEDGLPPRPLNIVVVGAGIGGLTAAIYLRKQGHKVVVLEQSRFANELGAAVHLAPNSNGVLKRIGIRAEEFGGNEMRVFTDYDMHGNRVMSIEVKKHGPEWQHKWLLVYRVHLHDALKKRATTTDWEGTPVELRTSSRVLDVDPGSATVTLENGETVSADAVIGADGVHSKTRLRVPPGDIKPKSSGKSAFRFLIKKQVVMDDPETAKFAQNDGELIIWYGPDRRVVMYPCSNNTMLNFVCIHPVELTKPSSKEYNQQSSASKLLEVYKEFEPSLLKMLSKVDESTLNVWELLDMDSLPGWTNQKLALLGDAAHPYLPHQGQGAGQAMEDAAGLAVALPLGTLPEEVPERLALYQQFRYERATRIQDFSRVAGQDVKALKPVDMQKHVAYNFGYDEWDSASQKFREWQWSKKPDMYWRMPISFGPMPGPRQRFDGTWPRKATQSTFTTASLKIKTSATVLKNLFPNNRFRFQSPSTVAYASFSQTTLDGMEWLGEGGYNHFGLYVHGVQFTKKDGSTINGTFLPLLFENLTDPIVTGREELGMPKLYCGIDVFRRTSSYRVQGTWQGATFANLTLEGLTESDSAEEAGTIGGEADDGILAWRYIPKVGKRGEAEVDHLTFVPHKEESLVVKSNVTKVRRAAKGSIEFEPGNWDSLPTLHHIVERLAEIPVFEVVGGKVVQGNGVPDVSSARRVD